MDTQNITLSVPKKILRQAKLLAVKRGTSVSGLLTRALEDIVAQDEGYEAARRRHMDFLNTDIDLGTSGAHRWTREELYDR